MLFNSIAFLFFFPVVTLIYFLLKHGMRWAWLLAASCFFYMFFRPVYIFILAFMICVDYFSALKIEQSEALRTKKIFLALSIVINVSVLAFFKYYGFMNGIMSQLFSKNGQMVMPFLSFVLPIGLSFHTFQSMSYTIEVYRGNYKAEKHFGIFALYVMFYPQLVAGPIERPGHMLPQFHDVHSFDYDRISKGLRRMLWGLFKKMVIADRLSVVVDAVYNHVHAYHGLPLIIATFFFSVQIYCDFSGYCDIALGAASVMGFRLVENFQFPYFSFSFREFWTRWHISLSSWFRDYLYIPLGGNRFGYARWILVILIVLNVSGLWHGAALTFVVWGFLHGVYLVAERTFAKDLFPRNFLRPVIVFGLVTFAWIFFRANNLHDSLYVMTHLFSIRNGGLLAMPSISVESFIISLVLIVMLFLIEIIQFTGAGEKWMRREYGILQPAYAVNFLLLCGILFLGIFEEQSFIYFQF